MARDLGAEVVAEEISLGSKEKSQEEVGRECHPRRTHLEHVLACRSGTAGGGRVSSKIGKFLTVGGVGVDEVVR